MRITNQKPQVLSPLVTSHVKGDFDPNQHLIDMIVKPIMTPLVPSTPASISHQGNNLDENDIASIIADCMGDSINNVAQVVAKQLFAKTLIHFPQDTNLLINDLFQIQSADIADIEEPSDDPTNFVMYLAADAVAASTEFIAGQCDYDAWFATFAFWAQPDTLGFAFSSEVAFNNFRTWLDNEISTIAHTLPPDTVRAFDSFSKSIDLSDLTESLWLRKSPMDGNEEYSFARMLPYMLTRYARDVAPNMAWICPFSLDRLLIPESIVLINIEAHARATNKRIEKEWSLIKDAIEDDIRVLKTGQVQKLTAAKRNAAKIAAAAAAAGSKKNSDDARSVNVRFRKTAPTTTDIAKLVSKILSKLAYVNHSQNVYKDTKMSFARPNRRDPDDYNRQGKVVSTRYRPDIHLYVDTSGSISEREYQDAVKACIVLARKLDLNLYFNSFSHVMTESVMLPTKGRSARQIWQQVQKVPKVTGGTDYEQIWRYIMASKKRRRELSLIITDFEYSPPNRHVDHPKNLYYLPISHVNWENLVSEASRFNSSMHHIFPQIRSHILL